MSVDSLIYSPDKSVSAAIKYLEEARENQRLGLGLRFPIETIANEYPIPPVMPGKILTVQGKSHNGKSTFLDFWKSNLAEHLAAHYRKEDIIISVLAEDMVEEQMIYELMRQAERNNMSGKLENMDDVKIVAAGIAATPIYYIGQSIERAKQHKADDRVAAPTMSNVGRAIDRIVEQRQDAGLKTNVQAVFVDYIQAMPMDHEAMGSMPDRTRRLQVRQDFFGLRQLAARIPAPAVMASQSKQNLEGAAGENMETPGLYDHQETSAIPQHTDSDISIWMPKTSLPFGQTVTYEAGRDLNYTVRDNLAFIRVNKQRGFDPVTLQKLPAGKIFPLDISFATGKYSVADVERLQL